MVFIAKTVVPELERVLLAGYGLPRPAIGRALLPVLGMPNVIPEAADQLALADALHCAAGDPTRVVLSFGERPVARGAASGIGGPPSAGA